MLRKMGMWTEKIGDLAADKEEKKKRTTFPQKRKSVEKKINNSDRKLKTKKRYDIIGL